MKKFNYFVILALFCAFCMSAEAQFYQRQKTIRHSLGVWAEVGEWTLLLQESSVDNTMGIAGVVGGTYELQKKHFLFDLGLGFGYGGTLFRVSDKRTVLANQRDYVDNERFDFVYEMTGCTEWYRNATIEIPILAGFTYRRLYGLAGFNMHVNMGTKSDIRGKLETYGVYDKYADVFRDMPEHQFYAKAPYKTTVDAHLNFDIDAHVELGARIGYIKDKDGFDIPESPVQFRMAVFAEYGFLDLHNARSNEAFVTPKVYNHEDMLSEMSFNPYLSTPYATTQVNNLFVGVKLTCLFQIKNRKQCLGCQQTSPSGYKGGTKIAEEPEQFFF